MNVPAADDLRPADDEPDGHVEVVEQPDGVLVEGEPYPILTTHA